MNTRRTFLRSLPLAAIGAASAQATDNPFLDPIDSAKTVEELKKRLFLADKWQEATYAKQKFIFGMTNQGDGESYIDLHGWIYNLVFKEWRRILRVNTRNIGNAKLLIDEQKGVVSIKGAAYNELNGVEVFRFDLRVTSNDAGYVH